MKNHWSGCCLAGLITLAPVAGHAQDEGSAEPDEARRDTLELDAVQVISNPMQTPGSVTRVGARRLELREDDDLLRVLRDVPGVHVRGEDGYGLRPNIGLRGTTTERSQKINLLEDGVLITPAPYSAPAAYYVPMMSRMRNVEVVKGPAAVTHGPNTVGGTINLQTRQIPFERAGGVDLAGGEHDYRKLHAHHGEAGERFGYLLEGLHVESSGFKELDTGGDTGFDKNNVMLKTRWNSDPAASVYHQFDLKLNYADELSDETYLGLSDDDFRATPLRRYAASEKALMDWDHNQAALRHTLEAGGDWRLRSTAYWHHFERSWFKLNRFDPDSSPPSLQEILANPDAASNVDFMAVLRGEQDSDPGAGETLMLGDNARQYRSRGIQSELAWPSRLFSVDHDFRFGVRLHEDQIERRHTEEGFLMVDGRLEPDGDGETAALFNQERARALAAYLQDEIAMGRWTVTPGLRSEYIRYESSGKPDSDEAVLLPALRGTYQLNPELNLLAGVHRGFVPIGPGQADGLDPEDSINYEAGLRYLRGSHHAELIGFFTDYRNLKGVCTFSSGCTGDTGEAFEGGEVDVYGLELVLADQWQLNAWRFPLRLVYSYTQTEFRSSFNSDFPLWNEVEAGDHLPYMPDHKLLVTAGISRGHWDLSLSAQYVDEQLEQAGRAGVDDGDGPLAGEVVDSHTVMDLVARYRPAPGHGVYLKVDNLLDETYMVSRRPFGARPGKPRELQLGYKLEF